MARSLTNLKKYWPANTSFRTTHILLEVGKVDNPRTGEKYVQKPLKSFCKNVDQLVIKTLNDLEASAAVNRSILKNYADIYTDNRKSLNNLFNQLLLLESAESTLIDEATDIVVFCRDDIFVYQSPIFNFSKLTKRNIIIPGFHWHRGYNDRFMIGSQEVARIWARRIHALETFSLKQKKLSGEMLVKYTLDKTDIRVLAFPRIFPRIRSNDKECHERNPLSINRPRELIKILTALVGFYIWWLRY